MAKGAHRLGVPVPKMQGDRIDGYCGFCGGEGHKARDCRALQASVSAETHAHG